MPRAGSFRISRSVSQPADQTDVAVVTSPPLSSLRQVSGEIVSIWCTLHAFLAAQMAQAAYFCEEVFSSVCLSRCQVLGGG